MFSKKLAVAVIGFVSIGIVTIAVVNPSSPVFSRFSLLSHEPRNSISGLPGGDGPILAVKIDDTRPAHPQIG